MGASLGRAGSLPLPMSAKRRAAIAAADAEDARRGPAPTYAADPGRYEVTCPHRDPWCRCDGAAHSSAGRLR